jgi:His-Xaa-Ser system radical SAM maturase HxsB
MAAVASPIEMQIHPVTFHAAPKRPDYSTHGHSVGSNDLVVRGMRIRQFKPGSYVAISATGDWEALDANTVSLLSDESAAMPIQLSARLLSKFLIASPYQGDGTALLRQARLTAKHATVRGGPSLHIIVPTLQCAHSCQYCQVSRALDSEGHTMGIEDLDAACEQVFKSSSQALTIEFQGGDPLLRFDLVQHAVLRITKLNEVERRSLRFVIASTLHQLTPQICEFCKLHGIYLSTSLDGPSWLHNRNRPTRERTAHERTVEGIELARKLIGPDSVSALMTTTKLSLGHAHKIVDEYVRLGLSEIFLRPLSSYGFAKRSQDRLGYSVEEFQSFYESALDRVLWWNAQGVSIREVYASIVCNKILSTFDAGYVDLQSPTGAGSSVVVYNYDGYVYPSDEARMLAETGDVSLRMKRIRDDDNASSGEVVRSLRRASEPDAVAGCITCAYHAYCGPNPVDAQAQHGSLVAPVRHTEHCARHLGLFDRMFERITGASKDALDIYSSWAKPSVPEVSA